MKITQLRFTLLLFVLFSPSALAQDGARTDVGNSYMFVFNSDFVSKGEEKDDVMKITQEILGEKGTVQVEFSFGDISGFFVVGVQEQQLKQLKEKLGLYGTFEPNALTSPDLPRPDKRSDSKTDKFENILPINNVVAAPCYSKICCGYDQTTSNLNLDWLDGNQNNYFCKPNPCTQKTAVFVLDTGVDTTHPQLSSLMITKLDFSLAHPSLLPWTPLLDVYGHGTHVMGIIATDAFGVTPNVKLYSLKVLNDNGIGSMATITAGLNYVQGWLNSNQNSKAIINLSVNFKGMISSLHTIVSNFANKNIDQLVIVAAAGNVNSDACLLTFPSVHEVVTVGSTNETLQESKISNYGPCVDIMAVGEKVLSTYLNGSTATMTGTSMAAPLVTGVLAQYWSENPTLTGLNLQTSIAATSSLLHAQMVTALKPGSPNKLVQYKCGCKCTPPTKM